MIQQIVAFDVGDRRVGVAFSDPFGDYAIPSDTYFRTGDFQRDIAALCEIAASRGAVCAVVGRAARGDLLEMGVSRKKDKKKKQVDSIAAAYILESYLAKIKQGEQR